MLQQVKARGNVENWLLLLGLEDYWPQFEENLYNKTTDLLDLKLIDKETLARTFNITKRGHLNKLSRALSQLKDSLKGKFKTNLKCLLYFGQFILFLMVNLLLKKISVKI